MQTRKHSFLVSWLSPFEDLDKSETCKTRKHSFLVSWLSPYEGLDKIETCKTRKHSFLVSWLSPYENKRRHPMPSKLALNVFFIFACLNFRILEDSSYCKNCTVVGVRNLDTCLSCRSMYDLAAADIDSNVT